MLCLTVAVVRVKCAPKLGTSCLPGAPGSRVQGPDGAAVVVVVVVEVVAVEEEEVEEVEVEVEVEVEAEAVEAEVVVVGAVAAAVGEGVEQTVLSLSLDKALAEFSAVGRGLVLVAAEEEEEEEVVVGEEGAKVGEVRRRRRVAGDEAGVEEAVVEEGLRLNDSTFDKNTLKLPLQL